MSCPYVNLSGKIRISASVITINENAMTIIANPVYDTVFKFLMEDNRVAKILLSALLQKEVWSCMSASTSMPRK